MINIDITKPCPHCGMQVEQAQTPFITVHPRTGELVEADRSWMCPLCDTVVLAVDGRTQVFNLGGPPTADRLS